MPATLSRSVKVCALVAAMVLAACTAKATPIVAKKVVLPDSAEQVLFGMSVVLTDNGVKKGRLLSDTAYMYTESTGKRLELRRVNVTFVTPSGSDDGTMTAKAGTFSERLNRLEGRGSVIVARKDGSRLESPQLVYDNARNQIFSDSSFVLHQAKQVTTGIGFESDPKLNNLKCMRNCKMSAAVQVPR
ncbi:MAG: LPS export ABC transporter periplasmic protein LptC [Gemmatimonadota bacterium]|nr:LPS export ABC transporter periplasmic protein LptC [Gemmatimonadota bacterium]